MGEINEGGKEEQGGSVSETGRTQPRIEQKSCLWHVRSKGHCVHVCA